MGASCSKCGVLEPVDPTTTRSSRQDSPDPAIYDLMRRSVGLSSSALSENPGQLFKQQKKDKVTEGKLPTETHLPPTRLLVRRHTPRHYEEGLSGTHIYAVRYPSDQPLLVQKEMAQEQAQPKSRRRIVQEEYEIPEIKDGEPVDALFRPTAMAVRPRQTGKSSGGPIMFDWAKKELGERANSTAFAWRVVILFCSVFICWACFS